MVAALWSWGVAVLLLVVAGSAAAVPIVSFDADPGLPGIQPIIGVPLAGGPFEVDVTISGVEALSPLNAFEFDLGFNPSFLSAVAVVDGGFLLDPVFVVEMTLGVVTVDFAEATLGPGGAFGDGVLATITFDPVGLGVSAMDLNNVLLSAPFGVPIADGGINDGSVTVVPEPSTAMLMALGLVGLGLVRMGAAGARRGSGRASCVN